MKKMRSLCFKLDMNGFIKDHEDIYPLKDPLGWSSARVRLTVDIYSGPPAGGCEGLEVASTLVFLTGCIS
jgi:hypothetical protein